ncbi:cytochrome b5 isoform X3 [Anastrepha ludens]|uniref:cytochrome b5 isoform X3 n=1 Tax=Anastrepha ludens TaxID=28586 RepID=UPI0023B1F576|nr:cytochrome b5 isoform X3 [Anastrepha ludens]
MILTLCRENYNFVKLVFKLDFHPGGEDSILEYAGKDATKAFNEVGHSTDAVKEMKSYKIGTIRAESTQILDTQPTSAANGPSEKQPAENYSQTQNKRKNFFFCC